MNERIKEAELVLPTLYLIKLNGGNSTTANLIPKLRDLMSPNGEDLEILNKRNDDKFSQKVRNLISHKTFKQNGYADYKSGYIKITDKGLKHLTENEAILKYLLLSDFQYEDIKCSLQLIENSNTKVDTFDENITITEGSKRFAEVGIYERSSSLREYAIKHFSLHNRIKCSCCTFDFVDFYGTIGEGFIEIHHIKPIFKYEEQTIEQTMSDAILNLAPLCSNCHRMIHRNSKNPIELSYLQKIVEEHGIFNKENNKH